MLNYPLQSASPIATKSSLSEALKALTLKGKGIAYLPRSIITQELAAKQLVQVDAHLISLPLQISLYRLKHSQSLSAKKLWQKNCGSSMSLLETL